MKMTKMILAVAFLFLFVACTPKLYTVNLAYEPANVQVKEKDKALIDVVVAGFHDGRKQDNPLNLGKVVKNDGSEIPVLPKDLKMPEAVTKGVRDHLKAQGFKVLGIQPAWDLKEGAIGKGWGDLLIGGTVEELDIKFIEKSMLYEARVKIAVSFADVKKGRIVHTTRIAGKAWQPCYWLPRERKLEELLNDALREVVQNMLDLKEVQRLAAGLK